MKEIFYMRREIRLVSLVSQPSGIISRDNPPSDFLFSFTGRRGEDTPEFGRSRDAPSPVKSRPYYQPGERRRRRRGRAVTWYFVLGSRYVLPAILYILAPLSSPTFPGPQRRRLPHPERWGYRTNGEFDDPNGGSELARAPPDTTRYSNADLGSGEARRGPTDTAVIHLAAGFRDSLTFLRIGPFADASLRDGDRLAARGRSSCGRQDVTPSTADGRSFRRIRSYSTYMFEYV